jgi:hypothetical protein
MDLIVTKPSPESEVKVEIVQGRLKLSAVLDTKGVDVHAGMSVETDYFLDELAKKIPGVVDDAMIAVLKQALKAL